MKSKSLPVCVACALLILVVGCAGTTKIHYKQTLNFGTFSTDPTISPVHTSGGGWVMVKIISIDNSDRQDGFLFDPENLYAYDAGQTGWPSWLSWLPAESWVQGDETVAAGQDMTSGLGCLVLQADGIDTDQVVFLNHKSSGNQSVLMVREGEVPSVNNPNPDLGFDSLDTATPDIIAANCQ